MGCAPDRLSSVGWVWGRGGGRGVWAGGFNTLYAGSLQKQCRAEDLSNSETRIIHPLTVQGPRLGQVIACAGGRSVAHTGHVIVDKKFSLVRVAPSYSTRKGWKLIESFKGPCACSGSHAVWARTLISNPESAGIYGLMLTPASPFAVFRVL